MSIGEAIFLLATIWCTIHALHYFYNRRTVNVLPTFLGQTTTSNWRRSDTRVSINTFQVKILTTKWNTYHDRLSSYLARRTNKKLGHLIQRSYDLGFIFGVLGMLVGVGGLLWMFAGSLWTLLQRILATTTEPGSSDIPRLVKRILAEGSDTTITRHTTPSRFSNITPIIPGVTVPLSDLPVIVLAVFVSQIVHELGHAIAAAHESLPMISAGFSFTVCIPAAFVSFPTSGMKNLVARGRSRVIAAGPFHNLVFWCFLMLLIRLQVLELILFFSGYKNISTLGKAVVGVSADSPLSFHLPPGSIITQLDDEALGNRTTSDDIWSDYLTGKIEKPNLGWCVAKSDLAKTNACCHTTNDNRSPFVCFISHDMTETGCIDPIPIMTEAKGHNRCDSSSECRQESTCVIPHKNSHLTRIMVQSTAAEGETETTVLWNGPSVEIWQEVEVGSWLPRIQILPLGFPSFVQGFWNYLTMATFSLYLFNLLPLPHLDGSELLSSSLDWIFEEERTAFSFDVEALENVGDHGERIRVRRRWKEGIMKYVPMLMTLMVVWCIVFWTINAVY